MTGGAAAYLERLQAKIYAAADLEPATEIAQSRTSGASEILEAVVTGLVGNKRRRARLRWALRRALEKEFERWRRVKPPTRYEDPVLYMMVVELAERIEDAARKNDLALPEPRPLFGTLPLGSMNAVAIRVPGSDEFIVAFHHGLFAFMNLLSKVVARSLPSRPWRGMHAFSVDLETVRELLDHDSLPLQRITELLDAYLLHGEPHAAPQYVLEHPYLDLSGKLRTAAETFVLAHEYGHLVAGHLVADRAEHASVGRIELDHLPPSWDQEIEADAVGLVLAVEAERLAGFDLALSYWGTDLVFGGIEIIDRGLAVLSSGNETPPADSGTHPPPALRRDALRGALHDLADEESARAAIQLAENVESILGELWARARPRYEELHAEGVHPAGIWLV